MAIGELFTVFGHHWLFTAAIDHHCSLSTCCTQPAYHQFLFQGIYAEQCLARVAETL